ncbi:hypothetical protein Tco_0137561 [Tanacetum coccineum]
MRPFGCPVTILNIINHLDALTKSMNYKPVVAGNQSNGSTGTKVCDDAGKARMEIVPGKDYILLPFWTADLPFSSSSKDSPDARFKPSGEEEKKDVVDSEHQENKDSDVPNTEEPRVNQDVVDIENNVVDENIVYGCIDDPNMPNLEENVYSDDDEEVGAEQFGYNCACQSYSNYKSSQKSST